MGDRRIRHPRRSTSAWSGDPRSSLFWGGAADIFLRSCRVYSTLTFGHAADAVILVRGWLIRQYSYCGHATEHVLLGHGAFHHIVCGQAEVLRMKGPHTRGQAFFMVFYYGFSPGYHAA
jgi:hypothetical protein